MAQIPSAMRPPSKASTSAVASLLPPCCQPIYQQRRCYASRSGEEKGNADKGTQAAAAAVSTTPGTATAEAVRYFAANEQNADAAARAQGSVKQQEQLSAAAANGGDAATSGIRTIGIKLTEDDELVRAFNNFSKSVNGCTQEEFLIGAKQAYYSLAVVISAFLEHGQPLAGRTESTKMIAAAHEAAKLLDKEFKPESRCDAAATSLASKAEGDGTDDSSSSSSKTKLQESLVRNVVSTIVSLIPVSRHLAESIFKIWLLHKVKQVNLSSIASPADYVLDSKLVIFARLGKARMYFNSDNVGAEVDVTFSNDYLRKLDPASVAGSGAAGSSQMADAAGKVDEDDFDTGMIQVHTDTDANAHRTTAEEHTFVVNKATRTLTPTGSTAASTAAAAAAASTDAARRSGGNSASAGAGGASAADSAKSSGTASRIQVTCVKTTDFLRKSASAATVAATAVRDEAAAKTAAPNESSGEEEEEAHSVYIKVNGNMLPPIPASAHACALLTVDVVVPPERYAYNFEWFYKRIVGYENEYERIAAARVFASNSPKPLASFLDFFMRMVTGKPVEFMFSKAIGRMIGIPDDVSQTPPATRKLMCMYMDQSYKWVLADLVTLAPVMETKLPKA
ncbi:conserved hypothetical protein [Leishmania major strain Friedlin]|uniref:Uncharacterized protein n=1 Tax=Leishmania major TaxID=5664 RepID=Q4QG57_LEIMA|nr:conserved hypothetical protein [Leishmania major strain Friedlin]CAG9571047.1 hypothetical_protein_-_conserved [Leishmania major strain Friedlin]CAJ02886.1 conserved hypothetical protein [Leishmania major strain Friedlin]|eukprot:XP_001681841.1 conserved hypothetical protein [Leishmania major strain Friedlin]